MTAIDPGIFNLIIFVLAMIVGSQILGLYLFLSLNLFGRHHNEAFSSLRIEDWKGFLRFRADQHGLKMYAIGIERVPKKWKPNSDPAGSRYVPDDPSATPPTVIDYIEL